MTSASAAIFDALGHLGEAGVTLGLDGGLQGWPCAACDLPEATPVRLRPKSKQEKSETARERRAGRKR